MPFRPADENGQGLDCISQPQTLVKLSHDHADPIQKVSLYDILINIRGRWCPLTETCFKCMVTPQSTIALGDR